MAACDRDDACATAYPRLRERTKALFARLAATPARAPIPGAAKDSVRINHEVFAAGLHVLLFQSQTAAYVPLVIQQGESGNFAIMTSVMGQIQRSLANGLALGMQLSVICAENQDGLKRADLAAEDRETMLGAQMVRDILWQCAQWRVPSVDRSFHRPVKSSVPTLMLTGGADPILSPRYAMDAVKSLKRGRLAVVPAVGHTEFSPCVNALVAKFIETPKARNFDTSCAKDVKRPPFALPPGTSR